VNAGRESEKDKILRMAQKANHLTESLVTQQTARADKLRSESITVQSPGLVSLMRDVSKQKFKHHDQGFHSMGLSDQM